MDTGMKPFFLNHAAWVTCGHQEIDLVYCASAGFCVLNVQKESLLWSTMRFRFAVLLFEAEVITTISLTKVQL